MHNRLLHAAIAACLVGAAAPAVAQLQLTVVPAAYANTDAVRHLLIPGISGDGRLQTLVGPSHLGALLGRAITAIELRRTVADETYPAASAHLTVTMSTSPRGPLQTSSAFAAHVGPDAVQVFDGVVQTPTSPPALGPQVAWTADNTVRIALQTPFVYTGGTLCIDVVGTSISGAVWWLADADADVHETMATTLGAGCGTYGGANGEWSSAHGFVAGGHTRFQAFGTPGGPALAAFGTFAATPLPLSLLGLPAPGCLLHLGSIDAVMPSVFEPLPPELQGWGGEAVVELWVPDDPAMFGASLTAQWLDLAQLATSNVTRGVVAASMPSLDMATIYGHPLEAEGYAAVHTAHVLRFEHQ
ncbi:MAG: hypothetical protein KAI24_15975 [Planctomycetes bacterium]|nr:hypothetical protein [Planctomycetota bacterium]